MTRLDEQEIASRLARLPGWERAGDTIRRTWRLGSFRDAVFFVNVVAALAEAANHHPDIDIRYRQVTLALTTHRAGGLTARDFALAEAIEAHTPWLAVAGGPGGAGGGTGSAGRPAGSTGTASPEARKTR